MSQSLDQAAPFDDVRDLAIREMDPDQGSADRVYRALLGMGREGDFGKLADATAWLSAWQKRYPPRIDSPTLAIFAGAHGLAGHGVSLSSNDGTRDKIDGLRDGSAPLALIAAQSEVNLRIFELALEQPTPNIAQEAAMTERECAATIAFGFEALEGDPDLIGLGVLGAGIGTAAAALACALYGGAPEYWVRPGPQIPDEMVAQRIDLVTEALRVHRGHLSDPLEALRCLGGREIAACVGTILAARLHGIPVLLDGFATTVAAGVVHAMNPRAIEHVRAAHVTRRPAHQAALERLGLTPLLPLEFNTGGGLGSGIGISLLRTACAPFLGVQGAVG